MKIITLVENSCGHEGCIAEHGLSIYIETEKHKLLLDTGQTDAVVKNAKVLGIDLIAVDTVIITEKNLSTIDFLCFQTHFLCFPKICIPI